VPSPVTRGRGLIPRVLGEGTRGRVFLSPFSSSAFRPLVSLFRECHGLSGTRGSLSSLSAILPRVQHSGKSFFPECPIIGTRESHWHSGNFHSPVVICYLNPDYWALIRQHVRMFAHTQFRRQIFFKIVLSKFFKCAKSSMPYIGTNKFYCGVGKIICWHQVCEWLFFSTVWWWINI
jgi:hypothetical protein